MKATKRKREAAQAAEPRKTKATAASTAHAPGDSPAAPTIVLASACTVKDAAALKSALCDALDDERAVALDAGAVERIDTAALQLVCAFVRDRKAQSKAVYWKSVSDAMREAARLLGAAELLCLSETEPAGACG
jgi:ABC-type transporter Mla MlaB component